MTMKENNGKAVYTDGRVQVLEYGITAKDLKNALKDKEGNEKLCPRKKGHAEIHYNCKL
jgi:hypothetical protein